LAKLLDKLARKIAGDTEDPILLERARAVAQAEFDLARVRQAKAALIERASAFGALDPPRILSSVTRIIRFLHALDPSRVILPKPIDAVPEALMLAHGFSIELLVELVHAGLATASAERTIGGRHPTELTRLRITDAGRRALAGRAKP
jgi:hypothetical protein